MCLPKGVANHSKKEPATKMLRKEYSLNQALDSTQDLGFRPHQTRLTAKFRQQETG